jgi:signal transduction histidine kinase
MTLAEFIKDSSKRIVGEWTEFAKSCFPSASLEQRRDHIEEMLRAVAIDIATPQSDRERAEKSKGNNDAGVGVDTAANAHGSDRANAGYTPEQMVSEFRALRASVLRLWSEAAPELSRDSLEEITRFNEALDQLLAESLARYTRNVDRSKELFLGVLGHDLRNPLGAILMTTTNMLEREGPDWRHARAASRIIDSGNRMDGMIRDLLDFTQSRLGTGIPVVKSDNDLHRVCRQAIDEFRGFHPEISVQLDATGELKGQWDSERMSQVLSNLLGNAYQHGAPGVPVEVKLRGGPEAVVLTVRNEGPPIASTDLKNIFSPFRQLDPAQSRSQRSGSIGLGLYIVDAIVTAHEGTISVQSNADATTFTVRLPR